MTPLDEKYYINVGPNGSFKESGNSAINATPADLDKIFNTLKETKKDKISIYFHGGLVGDDNGLKAATFFTEGILHQTDSYPISFVWETGFLETLKQNLKTIHKTKLFKKLIEKAVKITGKKLGIEIELPLRTRGAENLTTEEIEFELKKEAPFETYTVSPHKRSATTLQNEAILKAEIEEELEVEIASDLQFQAALTEAKALDEISLLDMSKLSDNEYAQERGIISALLALKPLIKIIYNTIKRHVKGRDHGFYPTIIEEVLREFYIADLGSWFWDGMKNKAEVMWQTNSWTKPLDQHVGAYFLSCLKGHINDYPETKINVVGHSAGSIAICQLIDTIIKNKLNIKLDNIIFLAPACRCELFKSTVIDHDRLYNTFRMFTMSDSLETKDRLVKGFYTRSLLYLISGVLEGKGKSHDAPLLGLQRHNVSKGVYSKLDVIRAIENFLSQGHRAIYAVTPDDSPLGMRCSSTSHGNFDNKGGTTMASVYYLIQNS